MATASTPPRSVVKIFKPSGPGPDPGPCGGRPARPADGPPRRGSEPGYYDISVVPLFASPGDLIGVGVSFVDVTRYRRVRDELAYANTELERAYEELQSLNEELELISRAKSQVDELEELRIRAASRVLGRP